MTARGRAARSLPLPPGVARPCGHRGAAAMMLVAFGRRCGKSMVRHDLIPENWIDLS